MKYTLIWEPEAIEDVARSWLAAENPELVTEASYRIQQLLLFEPGTRGQDYWEGLRVLESPPFRVLFYADEDDRKVYVLRAMPYQD